MDKASDLQKKATIFSVTLIAVMGVSSIVPILPLLGKVFAVSGSEVGLIIAVFTIPGVFFTIPAGILADYFGRKPVLIPALLLFSLAGFACAFATSFKMLLVCRFLQGLGAAPLGMLYSTIIGDMYEGQERLKVLGYNMTAIGVSTGCFPFLGGLLGQLDWRLTFCLPLLGLGSVYFVAKLAMKKREQQVIIGDYFKETLVAVKNPKLIVPLVLSMGTFILLYGPIITGLPLLSDSRFYAEPLYIGLIMAISAVGTALGATSIAKFSARSSPAKLIMISQGFYFFTMFTLPFVTTFWWLVLPMAAYGLGQGLGLPCISNLLLVNSPPKQRAVLMALNGTILRLAQSLGPLFAGLVQWQFGLNAIFFSGAILTLCLFIIAATYLRAPQYSVPAQQDS